MDKKILVPILLSCGWMLSACSTTPKSNPDLESAKANFESAQSSPEVQRYAPIELKEAEDALNKANKSVENDEEEQKIRHLSYVAKQRVAIAQELAELKAAEENTKSAEAERNKALLQARTEELSRIRQELNAKSTERGLLITLNDVLFDTGKSELKAGSQHSLQQIASFLRQNPDRKVSIEGFTDSVGNEEFNRELSERRAQAVREALMAQGVSANMIEAHGYGESYPVASNDSAHSRQLNRRVEIVVSEKGQPVAPR